MTKLQKVIKGSPSQAEVLASNGTIILAEQGLAELLEYCKKQDEEPPECSLTAESSNAEMLRTKAKRMLCDKKWWQRRLNKKARQAEYMIDHKAGKIHYEHDH